MFDLFDFVSSNLLLPLGGILIAVFVSWVWGADNFIRAVSNDGTLANAGTALLRRPDEPERDASSADADHLNRRRFIHLLTPQSAIKRTPFVIRQQGAGQMATLISATYKRKKAPTGSPEGAFSI
ncbi:hypothetical protein [Duganella aceris]|uniref:hypothetical protein n=1 Tax=Duganella aceris TaxID=2703883 RepID=UPI001E4CD1F8|nr:hypothetical protein [Duganella aceris]